MLVLHASWLDGSLRLWAESSRSRGRPPTSRWDAGAGALAAFTAQPGEETIAWLPSHADGALASTALLDPDHDARSRTLMPWIVTTAILEPEACDALLERCLQLDAGRILEPGVAAAPDLVWWAEAWRLARSVVARHHYLPSLTKGPRGYEARWKPVLEGPAQQRARQLIHALPPSARALGGSPQTPPAVAATVILRDFLSSVVDHAARAAAPVPPAARAAGLHQEWLAALTAPDPLLPGHAQRWKPLSEQIASWQRPLELAAAAPFRLSFRMNEPADEEKDPWRVEYLMQGKDDPSLLLDAPAVWKAVGASASARTLIAAREQLLVALGQASGLSAPVAATLRQKDPAGFALDTPGAYEFLTGSAALLEQNGYGVLLPSWWTGRGPAQGLAARASAKAASPKMNAASGLTLDAIVNVDWKVALGGTELSLAELRALAKLKAPLVKLRGQWVAVESGQLQKAIDFLSKKSAARQMTVGEAVRLAIGAVPAPGGLEVESVVGAGALGDLLAGLDGSRPFAEVSVPAGLNATLRPYQIRGYSWLHFLTRLGLGACLADDMGLGKTIQTLALIERRRAEQQAAGPVLLVCPTSVLENWRKECARFTPALAVMTHHGAGRAKAKEFIRDAQRHHVVVTSYALLQRDVEMLTGLEWDGLILDEAQNIKNSETKQAKAVRALRAGYRIALTGTPVENNIGDLWSLFEFLEPGLLGGAAEFKRRFFMPIQISGDQEAAARLKRRTGPFILRRLKTDRSIIDDLPDKQEMKVYCPLTKEQASLYAAVVRDAEEALAGTDGIQRKGVVLATLAKLKQVCNHPALFMKDASALPGRSGKLARLTEMLEEVLATGERALIFSQFAEMGTLLRQHLQETLGREVFFLHGGVPRHRRDEMVARFGQPEAAPLFVLSLKAGGTGLNLTAANHVFHFDRWWNPAVENQATDRAFRIGQTKNVQVHKFVCAGTLEERIDEMIEAKKDVAQRVVGTGEGWLTELSNGELKKLFDLRQEAIADV